MRSSAVHIIPALFFANVLAGFRASAQNVDLENALAGFRRKYEKTAKLKITGGVSTSTTYATGNAGALREPFVYGLSGNLTFSFLNLTIPVSLNLTNAGFSYSYQYPRLPSRIGIHPKYKAVQAHIGDFSMNFSPYTMSGFQIVGAGVDVQPKGAWKYGAFYGRFQKPVPFKEGNGNTPAAYKRTGAGVKVGLTLPKIQTVFSLIRVGDIQQSLQIKPDSINVFPKANLALSMENKWKITSSLQFDVESGLSFLTNDVRAKKDDARPPLHKALGWLTNANASTHFYKAFKAGLTYALGSSNVGIGYERIDPGYQTLGAYYFTNDLENMTVNFTQQLFANKLNLSMNAGMQRDDLKKEKTGSSRRLVTAVNASINGSKTFTSTLTYSNFQTVTNVKPQFQYINQLTPYDNLDTLNYRQLSQTAVAVFNFILRADKEKTNVLNMVLSFQDSYDEQAGIISKGAASQFYNLAATYSSNLLTKNLATAFGFNATYNTVDTNKLVTAGPTAMTGKAFFDKRLRMTVSGAYNLSMQQGLKLQEVVSGRLNASYILRKKHNLGLSGLFMKRSVRGKPGQDFSTTLTYGYSF